MLQPKRTKWRKPHKVSYEGKVKGNSYVAFGSYGLMALKGCWLTARQIEAARIVIAKKLGKTGKMWIRIFPHMSLTKKPLEVRMGSGKGAPDHFIAVVKEGTVMFEIAGVSEADMKRALSLAADKLPIKAKIIARDPNKVKTKIKFGSKIGSRIYEEEIASEASEPSSLSINENELTTNSEGK